jgi:hypothetical protein
MDYTLRRLESYSDSSLIDEMRRVAAIEQHGVLTQKIFRRHSRASVSTVIRRFGGWKEALAAAGLESRYSGTTVSRRMREQPGKRISRSQVVAELRRVAGILDRQDITIEEFVAHAAFSAAVVRRHFAVWSQALSAAGLAARPTSVRYSDEECFENLLRVWQALGRTPKYREMNLPISKVGGKAYVGRWGTWIRSLRAFVEYMARTEMPPAPTAANLPAPFDCGKLQSMPVDSGRIPLRVRYRVLVSSCFKCVICGRAPASDPQCTLHVDHIIPHSKGGKTIIENLRTLCEACNVGKGNLTVE